MKTDSLGDRMKKNYENVSRHYLIRRMPVIIRADGKAFHTFTRKMNKPFDKSFMFAMDEAALQLSKEIQGFKVGYVQSDEASFLITDYDDINTQGWFDYNLQKIVSISSATMSSSFYGCYGGFYSGTPVFDARAFNIPKEEVANYFLWRSQDWERNSLQMYAQSVFSHKQLHNKNKIDMHEMLFSVGKNWTKDLTDREQNGTWILGNETRNDILPNYTCISEAIEPLFMK